VGKLENIILRSYEEELFDHEVYSKLAEAERDPELKKTLFKLAEMEKKHSEFWREVAEKRGLRVKGN